MALTYTNIQHVFRKENALTLNEYVLCDMVFYLSKDSSSKVPNWCYMSKESMGVELGLSKQSVITLIKKMCESGFLEKQEVTGFVRTTSNWEKVYFTNGKESLPAVKEVSSNGKESLPAPGKESLPYNNILNNNINNEKPLGSDLFSDSNVIVDLDVQVLEYLNSKKPSKRKFEATKDNLKDIRNRIKEKFTFDDFQKVTDYKIGEWQNIEKMRGYIRPETLFGSKFNSYLIESENDLKSAKNSGSNNFELHSTTDKDML